MFGFIINEFFTGLTILSSVNPLSAPLKYVSMNNQKCKRRPEIVTVNSDEPVLYTLLVLKQVNLVVVVTISMIHMQKCGFLMPLKT